LGAGGSDRKKTKKHTKKTYKEVTKDGTRRTGKENKASQKKKKKREEKRLFIKMQRKKKISTITHLGESHVFTVRKKTSNRGRRRGERIGEYARKDKGCTKTVREIFRRAKIFFMAPETKKRELAESVRNTNRNLEGGGPKTKSQKSKPETPDGGADGKVKDMAEDKSRNGQIPQGHGPREKK